MTTAQLDESVLGWLDGRPLDRTELDRRLAALRGGLRSSALPVPGSAEDRQLTRWVAQVILTEQLCVAEAEARGLDVTDAPLVRLDQLAAVEFGSITAAAFEGCAAVRALYAELTAEVTAPAEQVAAYRAATATRRPGSCGSCPPPMATSKRPRTRCRRRWRRRCARPCRGRRSPSTRGRCCFGGAGSWSIRLLIRLSGSTNPRVGSPLSGGSTTLARTGFGWCRGWSTRATRTSPTTTTGTDAPAGVTRRRRRRVTPAGLCATRYFWCWLDWRRRVR